MRTWCSCMSAALQSAFIVIPKIPQTHHVCRDSARAWRKQMRAASQNSERSCNRSQKDCRPTTYKKRHRCLSILVRQRCFTQPACGCAFFCEALFFKCRNNRAVSAPALQSKAPSRLAKAFQFFKASAFVPDVICQGTPAKKRDKENGERKVLNKWKFPFPRSLSKKM